MFLGDGLKKSDFFPRFIADSSHKENTIYMTMGDPCGTFFFFFFFFGGGGGGGGQVRLHRKKIGRTSKKKKK